jgi:hypothetical protein
MARKKTSPTARTRTITIAGKDHVVEFNFLGYTTFHKLTGISLVKGVNFSDLEADEMIALLFAGLITHHKDTVDLEQLFTSLNGADFDSIYPKIVEACKESFPPPEEQPENPTKPIAN